MDQMMRALIVVATFLTSGLLSSSLCARPIGQGVKLGDSGVKAYPWLNMKFIYADNFYRTDGDIIPKESRWVSVIEPGIRFSALKGADAYNLTYRPSIGNVFDSESDNFTDHTVNADANWQLALRHRLRTEYDFVHGHDRRGSGSPGEVSRPNLLSKHPDVWNSHRVGAIYSFGAPGARGRIDVAASKAFRRYQNNNQEDRDNDRTALGGTFYARIMPKTSLLFDVAWVDIDYVNQDRGFLSSLDSQEWGVYGGVTWDTTAKTTGTFKLGYMVKDFEASDKENISDFGWQLDLIWRPRTYSSVDLLTERRFYESTEGTADAVVVSSIRGTWNHAWSQLIRSNVTGFASDDDYVGSVDGRQDNRYELGAGVFYSARPWLELGGEYLYETRDSNLRLAEYSNSAFMFTINSRY